MADTLMTISIVAFVAAGVFAVLAIILLLVFKIPSVIGDLSGATARKSIENMRRNNEQSGRRNYKLSEKRPNRVKLTETMEGVNKKAREDMEETGLLNENVTMNYSSEETALLVEDKTEPLVLEETMLLEDDSPNTQRKPSSVSIELLEEVMLIHTEEVIM